MYIFKNFPWEHAPGPPLELFLFLNQLYISSAKKIHLKNMKIISPPFKISRYATEHKQAYITLSVNQQHNITQQKHSQFATSFVLMRLIRQMLRNHNVSTYLLNIKTVFFFASCFFIVFVVFFLFFMLLLTIS